MFCMIHWFCWSMNKCLFWINNQTKGLEFFIQCLLWWNTSFTFRFTSPSAWTLISSQVRFNRLMAYFPPFLVPPTSSFMFQLIIGFESGIVVLWDLKSKRADYRYTYDEVCIVIQCCIPGSRRLQWHICGNALHKYSWDVLILIEEID